MNSTCMKQQPASTLRSSHSLQGQRAPEKHVVELFFSQAVSMLLDNRD